MRSPGPFPLLLWAAALACWAWLWIGARNRTRLMQALSTKYGGFVESGFSWITFVTEARELRFVRMCGQVPVRYRLRFLFPLPWAGRPGTIMEFELAESVFGSEPGTFLPGDLAGGRGFFLSGVNLSQSYSRFMAGIPGAARPRISWEDATVRLVVPGLLGASEEVWVIRCFEFLEELASRTCPPPRS